MRVVLASDRQGVFYEYFASEEADSLGGVEQSGSLSPGRNPAVHKRAMGPNLFIRFRNARVGESWAFESGQIDLSPRGRKRPVSTT
jgi:hypothetical protein